MSATIQPFSLQLPVGYGFSTATQSATAGTTAPGADVVSITNTYDAGSFTADSGDRYRVGDLFHGSAPTGQTVAGYRVALGSGGGKLVLGDQDVTSQINFTAAEFAKLTYVTGDIGDRQGLIVVAQLGTVQTDGSLSGEIDSHAVQITA